MQVEEHKGVAMRPLWAVADFMRAMRRQMRFGEFSRAPLRLLRLEWRGDEVECDWMARPPDVWDASLRRAERSHNASLQALADAMAVRDLIFDVFPDIASAKLRGFRQEVREPPALIVTGIAGREAPYVLKVSSIVMRAKLYGFRFDLEDGALRPLRIRGFSSADVCEEVQFDQVTL
jgi:hypothetical protein